ncbi:hypothetical protein [Paraflavitalea speifideaquila]|uniref:hypothetical protein n=1 Tax=Paraflavitalea speifideaquila TaxID=3076558 RepID=UPI0028E95169|nr:hypothetical protein [Paraflavitalea speifideiaquila]
MITLKWTKVRFTFSKQEYLFIYLYGATVLLYGVVLIDWASAHEFSVIPAGLLLAYIGSRLFLAAFKTISSYLLLLMFFVLALGQYYFINRPGSISRDGMAFNSFAVMGEQLKQVPKDYKIFMDLGPFTYPMIEYYAGRNITHSSNQVKAKLLMQQWGITKAVWVEHYNFHFHRIVIIE